MQYEVNWELQLTIMMFFKTNYWRSFQQIVIRRDFMELIKSHKNSNYSEIRHFVNLLNKKKESVILFYPFSSPLFLICLFFRWGGNVIPLLFLGVSSWCNG